MATMTLGFVGEELNLLIRQGATFGPIQFIMKNADGSSVNLTGCTIQGQIRKTALASVVTKALACTITSPSTGQYEISLTAAQTAQIKAVEDAKSSENKYVWDLELIDSIGRVIPLYYGVVMIFREVTR